MLSCRMLLMDCVALALAFALPSAGRSIPARTAMIAMTTSSSMSVNASWSRRLGVVCFMLQAIR